MPRQFLRIQRSGNLLNLGCGKRFHPAWVNLDRTPSAPSVIRWDVTKGIPYPAADFEVVYHSHLLEHLSRRYGILLINECRRVLKSRGILRVVVPDFERIVRTYVNLMDTRTDGDRDWQGRYDWIALELFDQLVRERSGGEMTNYLSQDPLPSRQFIVERIGEVAIEQAMSTKLKSRKASLLWNLLRSIRDSRFGWEYFLRLLLGKDYVALQIGRFRGNGEIHHWMYDRFSLASLLQEVGFTEIRVVDAFSSNIPKWAEYALDVNREGEIYKPDSLFMEAIKP